MPFSYFVVIFQDNQLSAPDPEVAAGYSEAYDITDIPVVSDTTVGTVAGTPYNGRELAGRCLLSPEMEIVTCKTGHSEDLEYLDLVREAEGL